MKGKHKKCRLNFMHSIVYSSQKIRKVFSIGNIWIIYSQASSAFMLHAQLIIWTAATEQEVKVIFQSSKGKLCNIDLMYLNCRNDSSNENWLLQQKCLHLAHHLQRHRSVSFLAPLSESGTVHLFSWIRLCWMSRGFPMLLF